MKLFLICLCIFLKVTCVQAAPREITISQDNGLISILNNVAVIAQYNQLPIAIRVLKVRDHGECGVSLRSCPKESIYIAVSSFDEYPDQHLYIFPKAYGWEFRRWVSIPGKDSPEDFAILEIAEKCLNESGNEGGWSEKIYYLYVNTVKVKLEEK